MGAEWQTDVLICGAGAAGLTLAIDLARRGVHCTVIEKLPAPFPRIARQGHTAAHTSKCSKIWASLTGWPLPVVPYPPQREYGKDGSYVETEIVEHALPTPAEPYAMPLMVPQFLTERVMRERLLELGRLVQFGHEVVGFSEEPDGVVAQVSSAAAIGAVRARYLIGADGGRSFVRQALDIGFPGRTLGVRAVVADLQLDGLDRDAWHRFNDGDLAGQLALCPLAGTSLFSSRPRSRLRAKWT